MSTGRDLRSGRFVAGCRRTRLLLMAALATAPAYGAGGEKDTFPDVAFYASESGLNLSLNMLFDFQRSGVLGDKPKGRVRLAKSEAVRPATSFVQGQFLVFLDRNDSTVYGDTFYEDVVSRGTERTKPFFRRAGAGGRSIGEVDGDILIPRGAKKADRIGQMALSEVVLPDGEKRTRTISRLTGARDAPWMLDLGGKIYAKDKDGKLTQVGFVGWRKVVLPDGKPTVLLMTRGMEKDAPWAGRKDDKLYLCPAAE